ncbi:hypothetical protein EZI54_15610 [Marinobacter halodurans]|uniref:Uncharacterized protein n=1 Tax=Marinobacter halodurans TaxID=2528979 RepID=A0ABY1ZKC4_9GAMM|nr:hypothetical protein [Marinobacter halodurans]TBW52920.1 hypothetical protein EZI54_15610 [Marinobacter halodurans]
MSLSMQEKEDLLDIIEIVFGNDPAIASQVNNFNERTVAAVEDALQTLVRCNDMRQLVLGLVGGANVMVKGWLRDIISKLRMELSSGRIQFDGLGCRVVTVNNWRNAVIMSVY